MNALAFLLWLKDIAGTTYNNLARAMYIPIPKLSSSFLSPCNNTHYLSHDCPRLYIFPRSCARPRKIILHMRYIHDHRLYVRDTQGIQCTHVVKLTPDRRLFVSQDYEHVYLSVAEFDDEYVQYVRGSVDEPKDGESSTKQFPPLVLAGCQQTLMRPCLPKRDKTPPAH